MRNDILERKSEILQWIKENQSKAFICRQLKCKPETFNNYLEKMGIDYSGNKGLKDIKVSSKYKNASEYASKECGIKSHTLKKKLIKEKIKEDKCEICGIKVWMGKELSLELHHIDGNHFNNSLKNLQILCPNCHSIQNNNSGSNIGKYVGVSELAQETVLEAVG